MMSHANRMEDVLPLFSTDAVTPAESFQVNEVISDDSIRLLLESFTEPTADCEQLFIPEAQNFDTYICGSPSSPEGVESGFSSAQSSPVSSPQQFESSSSYSSPTPSPQFLTNVPDFQQTLQYPSSLVEGSGFPTYSAPLAPTFYPQSPSLPVPPQVPTQVVQTTKKRRRSNDDNRDSSEVLLSREELLNLSSKGMEKYIHQLKQTRDLSRDEEKELKKQRRLIKNREYAQQSRKKKKSYVGELEGKVEVLTAQNAKLHAEVAMLNAKVMAVTSENAMLRNSLGQMQATAAKKKPKNLSAWPFGSSDTTKIVGGTGALLCGILFFALFFSFDFSGLGYGQVAMEGMDFSRGTTRALLEEREAIRKATPPGQNPVKAGREISGLNCNLNDVCYLQKSEPAHTEQPSINPDNFTANNVTAAGQPPLAEATTQAAPIPAGTL